MTSKVFFWFCGGGGEDFRCRNVLKHKTTVENLFYIAKNATQQERREEEGKTDDGQLAFLCDSTAKGDIVVSVHRIKFY